MSQYDVNIFLNTPINSEEAVKNIWEKYFKVPFDKIINDFKEKFKDNEKLTLELEQYFPGNNWIDFAYETTQLSFADVKSSVDTLWKIANAYTYSNIVNDINNFYELYKILIERLKKQEPNSYNSNIDNGKIKRVQELLNLQPSGKWDINTNKTFISWLQNNGWDQYLKNGKFTGNIDDAIRALLIDKNTQHEMASNTQKRSKRIDRVREVFGELFHTKKRA